MAPGDVSTLVLKASSQLLLIEPHQGSGGDDDPRTPNAGGGDHDARAADDHAFAGSLTQGASA